MKPNKNTIILLLSFLGGLFATCNKQDSVSPNPLLVDPANFVSGINNRYYSLTPGDTLHYLTTIVEGTDTSYENDNQAVTRDTKVILGVTCILVHDVVSWHNKILEDTYDWYAQDRNGNVWYFGEDTKKYDSTGNFSTRGSWTAGVNGAVPGFIMQANAGAQLGTCYRQEYLAGNAEDQAMVIDTNVTQAVPYGTFNGCIETQEFTVLEPGVLAYKYYARGVGQVSSNVPAKGESEVLVSITR